jgi:hypothetical protein
VSSATCATCSKWSLACIHAAALNAFDEHDADPDARLAARTLPPPKCRPHAHAVSDKAPRHHPRHREQPAHGPPMLRRWHSQSPHQESFHGVATTEAASSSPRTTVTRL